MPRMGIGRDTDWGSESRLEQPPPVCRHDRDLAHVSGGEVVALAGGHLWEVLGRPHLPAVGDRVRVVGLDGIRVTMTTRSGSRRELMAADSVILRRPIRVGGPFRGPVVIASNSGRLRGRDLLPRAHPNDGRFDVLTVRNVSVRQRWIAWSRAMHGDHLPHPGLVVSRCEQASWAAGGSVVALIDGRRFACVDCRLEVSPDHWRVALPVSTV